MKYSFSCIIDNTPFSVEAKSDADAVKKLTELAKKHLAESHPDAGSMTDPEWAKLIRGRWKKQK